MHLYPAISEFLAEWTREFRPPLEIVRIVAPDPPPRAHEGVTDPSLKDVQARTTGRGAEPAMKTMNRERGSPCSHLSDARKANARTPDGCEECLQSGDNWVHLRLCLSCGHVGCRDSSKNRHATKHFQTCGHPTIASYEPGENWSWCFVDQLMVETALLR